jgi:putative ABC transport system ATP-binding protein
MLTVTGLHKTFHTDAGDVHALDDVSFDAASGQMVAIVGPSGSGKSTLLALLGLLDSPDSGTVEIDGRDLGALGGADRSSFRARHVGFVFQQYNLIPNLSARENVMLALEFAGWPRSTRAARADEMLEMVGLDASKAQRRPGKLSGGEQQRVAIARAFAADPPLILADEPTGSLDRKNGRLIVELLRSAASRSNATVLVVTHDEDVARAADRRFEIEDGRLREQAA